MSWTLRFHGVGNASATELGSPMATIERDGAPWLTIDCGSEGLTACLAQYGSPPRSHPVALPAPPESASLSRWCCPAGALALLALELSRSDPQDAVSTDRHARS